MKSSVVISAICLFGACAAAGAGIPPAGFERRAMLCDFEHGAAGWSVAYAEAGLSDEEPHSGEACLKITKAADAEFAEIRRRFTIHDSFEAIAVYVWHEPGEEPPLLWAVARDEYGAIRLAAMEPREDQAEQEDAAVLETLGG